MSQGTAVDATKPGSQDVTLDVFELSDIATRGACRKCHSHLTMYYHGRRPDSMYILLGSIDQASIDSDEKRQSLLPIAHIFAEQRMCWYDIEKDGIDVFDRFRPT